jgi:hypothetical protein
MTVNGKTNIFAYLAIVNPSGIDRLTISLLNFNPCVNPFNEDGIAATLERVARDMNIASLSD